MAHDSTTASLSMTQRARLEACPPLAELGDDVRVRVIDGCAVLDAPRGTVVIRQDEPGDAFYVLLEGAVEVLKVEADGREVRLSEQGPGAFFGEQALLGASVGRRSATVRTTQESRCAVFRREVFRETIATSGMNAEAFEKYASHFAYNHVRRSLEAFAASLLDASGEGGRRVEFAAGETIIREGDPSDAAFLVLEGVGRVVQARGDEARALSQIGAGQVIGEVGVLQGKPRTATVIAEGEVSALRIEAEAFREWRAAHPTSTQFFDSLAEIYTLAEGRRLNVYLGDIDGEKAITTVRGEPTRGVVSTRILERGVVVFANAAADAVEGERERITFAEGDQRRELRVIVKTRKNDRIETCVIYGVAAEGVGPDLGELYHRVSQLDELGALELRRFEKTGYLGGAAHTRSRGTEGMVCPCLGLRTQEMTAAIDEVGPDFNTLRTAVGVSTLCGGCEPAVRSFIEQSVRPSAAQAGPVHASVEASAPPPTCPAHHAQVLEQSGYPLPRIRRLLRSWDARGEGRVRREDVALRFRGLGVRDMDAFLDTLFPGALPPNVAVPVTSLIEAITQVMDFDEGRMEHGPSYATRKRSSEPTPAAVLAVQRAIRFVLRNRQAALGLGVVAAATAALGVLGLAAAAGPLWLGAAAIAEAATFAFLWNSPSLRYYVFILLRGESRTYSAMFSAFGFVTKYAVFRPLGPLGPGVFYIRGEQMVEEVLSRPRDYVRDSRLPLDTYPPFGVKSLLWGGVDGYWLGYRNVCEEYFVSGYEADIPEMTDIIKERVRHWIAVGEIDLLEEIYRIVLEIRARIFFQTTFHCYDDNAPLDFAELIDRVLSGSGLLDVDPKDADVVHQRVMEAVRGATRPGSVGHSLRQCLESGDLEEGEVLHNAVMYVLAQAPTMAIFWTLYRSARTCSTATLRGSRRAIVQAVKEEMRLHPPVTSMFLRTAARDGTVDGVFIPKGSPIFVCPFLIQTNPTLWTDPQQFEAGRWTSTAGVAKEIVEPRTDADDARSRPCPRPEGKPASRYLPFGAGAHACQGRWFASDEMLLVVDTVLQMVDLEVVRDDGLLDRALADQVTLHVYSRPSTDVRLHVTGL